MEKLSDKLVKAIESSPNGVASLDVLESLGLCGPFTLRTTLSRLSQSGRILRLKRGLYSANPMKDAFLCAQSVFNGYLAFSTALYLQKLIAEAPFTVTVVTKGTSRTRRFGEYEFRAVALKEKAVGFERKGGYVLSTRAKTLFDCLYVPKYSVEEEKLFGAFGDAELAEGEWREFGRYVKKFASGKTAKKMEDAERSIRGRRHG